MSNKNTTAWKVGFRWTKGDVSNPAGALALDGTSRALHICEIADVDTDWNVSGYTHPSLLVHSATTPPTDYLKLYHDATNGYIDSYGGNLVLAIAGIEKWRIDATGNLTSGGGIPANVTAAGAIIATGGIAMTDVLAAWIDDATHGIGTVTHYIGNQTITTASDIRVKRDITDTVLNATELFRKMRVVDYWWSDPEGTGRDVQNKRGRFTGMIAQETVDIVPYIVNAPDKDCPICRAGESCAQHPSYWHVQYDHLVPVVVKGLQEMDKRVADLEQFQEHAGNGWLKERFMELLDEDEGFRVWAKERIATK